LIISAALFFSPHQLHPTSLNLCAVLFPFLGGVQMKQMKLEARSQDAGPGSGMNAKVQNYEKSLGALKADFQRAKEKEDKEALMGGGAVSRCAVEREEGREEADGLFVCVACGRARRRSTGNGCSTPTTSTCLTHMT
jgi:hypothetical protein